MGKTYSRSGKRVLGGRNTFSIDMDTSGLQQYLDALDEGVKDALRPAAQAAAQVIYDRVKVNVQGIGQVKGNLNKAIYQAFSPEKSKKGERSEYHVSWNHKTAPHGHLLEYGWTQRYAAVLTPEGKWKTAVRPEMMGKPKPGRRAPQSEKDAYYLPRPGGPVQHTGRAFMRSAESSFPEAYLAAEDVLIRKLMEKG